MTNCTTRSASSFATPMTPIVAFASNTIRAGRPDDPRDSLTPSSEHGTGVMNGDGVLNGLHAESGPMRVVESISDGKRTFVPVPQAKTKKDD